MKTYWSDNITIEVRLPYITQGCALGYLSAKLDITAEDIWLSWSGDWKCCISYGDAKILLSGKNVLKNGEFIHTTHKVKATNTYDGINHGNEQYKVKVLAAA